MNQSSLGIFLNNPSSQIVQVWIMCKIRKSERSILRKELKQHPLWYFEMDF
jgi:hypothetical protein